MSDADPGLRRQPAPDPAGVGEDAELVARIRAEIAERGPITVARFMERALYEPGHGYYRRPEPGPGAAGDFLTAPEVHPLFGAAIGRLLEDAWIGLDRPDPFVITEPGAGTGALAVGLLDGLRRSASPFLEAIAYRPVDIEPARHAAFAERLTAAGFADRLRLGEPPSRPIEIGAVIANEVADALPVHRVVVRSGVLHERLVTVEDQRFLEIDGPPASPALAARLADKAIRLDDDQVVELCLALDAWLAGATRHLAQGLVLVIDYGEEADRLYRPERPGGTLRGFARHAVTGDPYHHVGRQDLTAHVDLTALHAAARAAGLATVARTTQAELLAAIAGELARLMLHDPGASLQDGLALRSALARLMDPSGMGGFAVCAFGRGLPADLALPAFARLAARPGQGQRRSGGAG